MEQVIRKSEVEKILQQLQIKVNADWWDKVVKQGMIREYDFSEEQVDQA